MQNSHDRKWFLHILHTASGVVPVFVDGDGGGPDGMLQLLPIDWASEDSE